MKSLPQKIAVIGAGVMGLCVKHMLRRDCPEAEITIADRSGFPQQHSASMMAGGMLAPYSEIEHLPPEFMKAALTGMKFWAGLPREKTGFTQSGSLLLAHQEDLHMLDRFTAKLPALENAGPVHENEIGGLEPLLSGRFSRGIYIPQEAFIDPTLIIRFKTRWTGSLIAAVTPPPRTIRNCAA